MIKYLYAFISYRDFRFCLYGENMGLIFNEKIKLLAESLDKPLYAVGGYVRNFLTDGSLSEDVDLAGGITAEDILNHAKKAGFRISGEYPRTGTVVFTDGCKRYEFTSFREEKYRPGGGHSPEQVEFTEDIHKDALRRDFKCNAVYYDIKNQRYIDPTGGIKDIKKRTLSAVTEPEKVFVHDGLRLMRLARFTGELGFTPSMDTLDAAKKYSSNIRDISPERIYSELLKILTSDSAYSFSDKKGHYTALQILNKTGVLGEIMPELWLGKNMPQPEKYHNYDVLEHSLRTVLYAPAGVRLAALLHDVGKPERYIATGKYHSHEISGAEIAEKILLRLKAPKSVIRQTARLVRLHMYDLDGMMRESKIRKIIVENIDIFDKLLQLKQADFSACKDSVDICPTVNKWRAVYEKMQKDGTPFSLKDLNITALDLQTAGFTGKFIGEELKKLFMFAVTSPSENNRETLVKIALSDGQGNILKK